VDGRQGAPDPPEGQTGGAPDVRAALGGSSALEKHARASESYAAISAALGCAATEKGIPISAADLDQQPFLLNC
jgi:hypothetical protein